MNTHRLLGVIVAPTLVLLLLIGSLVQMQAQSLELPKALIAPHGPASTFTVTHSAPPNAALGVALDVTISASFAQPVLASTISTRTFTVRGAQTGVYTGSYGVLSGTFVTGPVQFDPAQGFKPGEEIVVNLSHDLQAAHGATLIPYAWSFRTAVSAGGGVFSASTQGLGNADSYGVALGDLDGDADLDAFVANFVQPNKVWLNAGLGIFDDSGQSLGATSSGDVGLGDVDNDGDLDAFVANFFQPNEVWLNDGSGTFSDSGQRLGHNVDSYGVALGDLDGDGDLDAYVANDGVNEVWFNAGTGTFDIAGGTAGWGDSASIAVALGDLDNDGDLDALVANWRNQANQVWQNDGTGIFTETQSLGNADSVAVALGDLDGDGDLDAWIGNLGPDQVWLNAGAGVFNDSGQLLGDTSSLGVALGDVDGDGDLDAFVANSGDQANRVWLNNGAGIFRDSRQSLGGSDSWGVALGDVDGDGDLDAWVVNSRGQANRVWLNHGALADLYVYLPLATRSLP